MNERKLTGAIIRFINGELAVYETSVVYNHLKDDFGLEDSDIAHLGFDWIIPERKPGEEPLKRYDFLYSEPLTNVYSVLARNEREAWDKIEDTEINLEDLCRNDGEWTLLEASDI